MIKLTKICSIRGRGLLLNGFIEHKYGLVELVDFGYRITYTKKEKVRLHTIPFHNIFMSSSEFTRLSCWRENSHVIPCHVGA